MSRDGERLNIARGLYSRIMQTLYIVKHHMKTAAIGARVSGELKQAVIQLSALSGQSVSAITQDALLEYMAWRLPQIEDLKQAIIAADKGEFASDGEVTDFFAQYGA
jgi:predicted transcriptional regulator